MQREEVRQGIHQEKGMCAALLACRLSDLAANVYVRSSVIHKSVSNARVIGVHGVYVHAHVGIVRHGYHAWLSLHASCTCIHCAPPFRAPTNCHAHLKMSNLIEIYVFDVPKKNR